MPVKRRQTHSDPDGCSRRSRSRNSRRDQSNGVSFGALPLSGSHGSRRAPYIAVADRFAIRESGRGLQVALEVHLSGVS